MAGTINPQDACEHIISTLSSDLAAKLSDLETEYGDGISLPTPGHYWRGPQTHYPGHCNVVVVPAETEPDNSPDQLQGHRLLVEIVVAGQQSSDTYSATELITIRLWRMVRALQEVLNKSTLSGNVDKCFVARAEATEFGQEGKRFEQRAEVELLVHTST